MTNTPNTIMSHGRSGRIWTGTPVDTASGAEALAQAGLDWTVKNHSLSEFLEFENRQNANRHQVALRSDGAVMGMNGKRHTIIQNEAMAELGDAIIKFNPAFRYTAGGSSKTGETTFLVLTSEETVRIGRDGDDVAANSIMICNDFNGNVPLAAIAFLGRFFCTNQIRGLLSKAKRANNRRLVTVRHTSSSQWALEAAKRTLIEYVREIDEVDAELQRLLEIELDRPAERALREIAAGERPSPLDANGHVNRAFTQWEQRFQAITTEHNAPWNEHLHGTALGVVMGAQGYDEHRSRCRKGERDQARTRRLMTADYPAMQRVLAAVS